ncbi:hypothetical protein [Neobacillus niacini]|uniref:hypothetical protein n=1 Tax=Neobacillus niacini TaxID=86668 RepID=UPI0005F0489C|nr:hypothetical protein [Neobacillus niacini]
MADIYLLNQEGQFDENVLFEQKGRGKTKTMFWNRDLNNVIIIDGHKGSSVSDVIGYVVGDRFTYLSEVLHTRKNVVALISKVEGTTSDYIISYDFENPQEQILWQDTVHKAIKVFHDSVSEKLENVTSLPADLPEGYLKNIAPYHGSTYSYKTVEIMNGKAYRCGEIPEEVFEAHFE